MMDEEGYIALEARNAVSARREARERWPQGGKLRGYVKGDPEAVYLTAVRRVGDKHGVATATRNRSPRPTFFMFKPDEIPFGEGGDINRHFKHSEVVLIKNVLDHRLKEILEDPQELVSRQEYSALKALREKFGK